MPPPSALRCWILPIIAVGMAVAGGGSSTVASGFFLASAVLMGLAHGGCDPWLPYWLGSGVAKSWAIAAIYFGIALAMAGLWWLRADLALLIFLGNTAWHWGTTDARVLGIRRRWLWASGRGLLITGALAGWHVESTLDFFKTLTAVTPLLTALTVWGGWVALLGFVFECVALRWGRHAAWRRVIAESAGLACLFAIAHPLLAVTAYYAGMHALRSIYLIGPWLPLGAGRWPLWRFHRLALPGALAVLPALPLCGLFLSESTLGLERWAGCYFILLSILTLPHALLFTMLPESSPAAVTNP
jgi:beta-carotene 15,15'-dioxygenase